MESRNILGESGVSGGMDGVEWLMGSNASYVSYRILYKIISYFTVFIKY